MRPKHSTARESLLEKTLKTFESRIKKLQVLFIREILDYLETNLDIRDGVIRATTKNYRAIDNIGIVAKSVQKKQGLTLIKWVARRYVEIALINKKYFKKENNGNRSVDNISATVQRKLLAQKGISVTKDTIKISANSFLRDAVNFEEAARQVKQIAMRMAADGQPLIDLKKSIRTYSRSTDKALPVKKLERVASETFKEFDRGMSHEYGKRLGLRAAIWQGGVIQTTREICDRNNNRVFTYDELRAMESEEWEGKWPPAPSFNIFIHVGGIECRHQLDHISDALAIRLRPELKDLWGL